MKKILLSGLLFIVGAVLEICAQSIILDNKLQFESADALSSPPEGWSFTNCSLEQEGEKWFVMVGDEGSVTTPPLTGLNGNANIVMLVKPSSKSNNYEFNISVIGEGEVTPTTADYTAGGGWKRVSPFLLKNATSDTRIVFSGNDFEICNVTVTDIGDAVFYESYDRCSGDYGQNGNFGYESTKLTKSMLDNLLEDKIFKNITATAGKQCVFFPDDTHISTPAIPASETGCYIVSFRLAGYKSVAKMSMTYYSNNGDMLSSNISDIPSLKWENVNISISDVDHLGGLGFYGKQCFLDELKVYEVKALPMSESSSETSIPAEWLNKTVCMSLTRTFQKDIWNTCCLPFDFDASLLHKATGNNNFTVELRHLSDITSEGIYHFGTITTVPAGEPFLLKVGETVSNPEFRNVVVKALTPASATSPSAAGYAFAGCYGKTTLATDGTHVFIGTDGLLHRPTETGNTMKGMRAYMVLPSNQSARGLVFDDTPTAIEALKPTSSSPSSDVLYNLSGQRVAKPAKGLYIKNGKKIIVNHK